MFSIFNELLPEALFLSTLRHSAVKRARSNAVWSSIKPKDRGRVFILHPGAESPTPLQINPRRS